MTVNRSILNDSKMYNTAEVKKYKYMPSSRLLRLYFDLHHILNVKT